MGGGGGVESGMGVGVGVGVGRRGEHRYSLSTTYNHKKQTPFPRVTVTENCSFVNRCYTNVSVTIREENNCAEYGTQAEK